MTCSTLGFIVVFLQKHPETIFFSFTIMSARNGAKQRGPGRPRKRAAEEAEEDAALDPQQDVNQADSLLDDPDIAEDVDGEGDRERKSSLIWLLWEQRGEKNKDEGVKYACLVCEACKATQPSVRIATNGSTSNLGRHFKSPATGPCAELYSKLVEDAKKHKGEQRSGCLVCFLHSYGPLFSGESEYDSAAVAQKLLQEVRDQHKDVKRQSMLSRYRSRPPEDRELQVVCSCHFNF